MDIVRMRKTLLLRKLKEEPSWAEAWMDDPEKAMEELEKEPAVFGEKLPIVSVGSEKQLKDVVFVKFLGEPTVKPSFKDPKKEIAYVKIALLKDHSAYDSATKKEIPLTKGARAVINLKRHAGLWSAMESFKPLTDKSFVIGNLGRIKTKKGHACDYRVKQLPS